MQIDIGTVAVIFSNHAENPHLPGLVAIKGTFSMKALFTLIVACAAVTASAQTYVAPYINSNGTVVEGHYRSTQNGTKLDNYTTQGNTNPYNGQSGTVDPYKAQSCGHTSSGKYVCR